MEKAQDLKCLHCDSDRVVAGYIDVYGANTIIMAPTFTADELKTPWLQVKSPRLRLERESGAVLCLDCGLVWTSVNVEDATHKLTKYGTDEMKSRVGLD